MGSCSYISVNDSVKGNIDIYTQENGSYKPVVLGMAAEVHYANPKIGYLGCETINCPHCAKLFISHKYGSSDYNVCDGKGHLCETAEKYYKE